VGRARGLRSDLVRRRRELRDTHDPSNLQDLNGKTAEAKKTFDKAINDASATPIQIHVAARQLLTSGKAEAVQLFQLNAKRLPTSGSVHVGLMRAYAATGDNKKALAEAKLAPRRRRTRQQEEPGGTDQETRGRQDIN
jgi:predicted Zn-dependent protease